MYSLTYHYTLGDVRPSNEPIALEAIRNWEDIVPDCALVEEHIETRSLFVQEKPGVEQVGANIVAIIVVEFDSLDKYEHNFLLLF